jgi:hypothetical protein
MYYDGNNWARNETVWCLTFIDCLESKILTYIRVPKYCILYVSLAYTE